MKQLPSGQDQTIDVSYESPEEEAPSLRDLFAILQRRRAIAIQAFIVVVALGVVVTMMTKPTYRSSARVLVEGKTATVNINNTTNPLSNLFLPTSGFEAQTQVEILRSSTVAAKVYKESGVAPGQVFLDVRRTGDTDVIDLSGTSNSKDAAYSFISTLPKVYLRDMRADRMREVSAALKFAQNRLKEENQKLRRSESALADFKSRSGVIDPSVQREGELAAAASASADLSKAQVEIGSLQAQLDAFVATRRSLPGEIVNPTTTTNTAALEALRQRIDELRGRRKELLFLYKANDDEVRKVDLQIADVEARLRRTPRDTTTVTRAPNPAVAEYDAKIADTRASLQAAQANLQTLRVRARLLASNLNRYNPIERGLAQLQRDVVSSTAAVASLTLSVDELTLRQKALESANDPITIIEAASQPAKVSPNVTRNIILALALGLLLACGAAMLQESLDDHLRDEDEVRRLLGASILGHFPLMPEGQNALPAILRAARMKSPQALELGAEDGSTAPGVGGLVGAGTAPFTTSLENGGLYAQGGDRNLLEKFRVLRSNVQFTLVDREHSTLLITSSVPQEGKSYTASNLATAMAFDGRRVILIDADLHRPRQHEAFDVPLQPGLTNVLVGQAKIENTLHETGVPGLRLLTAGVLPPNPVELLNSPSMEVLLETLRAEADILIFDSPPLLATADAQVLASKVDGVLYVMQLGRVPKSAIQRSFELLQQARANVLGIALNKIDASSHRNGHYGSYYYGGYYGGHYSDSGGDARDGSDNRSDSQVNGTGGPGRPSAV